MNTQSFKKVFAVFLACVLILSLTACNGNTSSSDSGTNDSSTPATSGTSETQEPETVEITAFAMEGPYTTGDFNDLAIWKYSEEATGVKVNFETAPSASFEEKLALKFASNELPDVFFKCNVSSADITKYSTDGTLIALDDYLEEYAPNFSAYMAEDSSIEKNIRMSDGSIYGFPYLVTASPSRISPKLFINQVWLDELNMEVPTTTDELYDVLSAMKGNDFNGNGTDDEIPLAVEGIARLQQGLMGSWGLLTRGAAQLEWDIDPDTNELRFIQTSDNYKGFLEYANKLYTEKLLDQECFTADLATLTAKAEQNILGVVFCHNSSYLGSYADDFTYIPCALKGPNGDQIFGGKTISVAGQNTFITNVNQHVADTVRWVDWFYSDEGIEHYFMGVEGETYEFDENGEPQFTDFVISNPDGLNMEEALGSYVCWSGGANPSVADDLHFGNHLIPELTVDAAQALSEYSPEEVWGTFNYAAEDSDRISVLTTDISTYLSDMTAKFITGETGFDQWDSYKDQVDKMGLEEYREIVQRTVDAYEAE